ncbi:MAG: lipid asymmetry maintenance protein MlaB [Gammaproteobacteria bacterium]
MPTIKQATNGAMIEGELTFRVIPSFINAGYQSIDAAQGALTFDLSGVTRVDSASLALLIDWVRYAKHKKKSLTFIHLPEKIQQMMTLSNFVFPS